MSEEQQTPLLYQDIVEEILYESLEPDWIRTNISTFSDTVSLFDYQQDAIRNAVKLLYYYFGSLQKYEKAEKEFNNIERKKKFYNEISSKKKT
jgi:type III restriction enzyme